MPWIIDGTPELELISHWRRITSVCISFVKLMSMTVIIRLYARRSRLQAEDAIITISAISMIRQTRHTLTISHILDIIFNTCAIVGWYFLIAP